MSRSLGYQNRGRSAICSDRDCPGCCPAPSAERHCSVPAGAARCCTPPGAACAGRVCTPPEVRTLPEVGSALAVRLLILAARSGVIPYCGAIIGIRFSLLDSHVRTVPQLEPVAAQPQSTSVHRLRFGSMSRGSCAAWESLGYLAPAIRPACRMHVCTMRSICQVFCPSKAFCQRTAPKEHRRCRIPHR